MQIFDIKPTVKIKADPELLHRKLLIIKTLLEGGNISHLRLRDKKQNPVMRLTQKEFEHFFVGKANVLKRNKKKEWFVISIRKVTQLHGKSLIKQYYKLHKQHAKENF